MPDPEPGRYWARLARDVVGARGDEATAFLQGQLSQDVAGIDAGGHAWSWLLAPNGKVDALVRVWCFGPGDWALDTDAGWGEAVLGRLSRFKLRTKVELAAVNSTIAGVRGGGWSREEVAAAAGGSALVASPPWPGVGGADVLWRRAGGQRFGVPEISEEDYEAERILAGMPRMGAELTEKTIPAETGLIPLTVSFTKGCYTGQELVARVDSRGSNVARRLRGLRLGGPVDAGSGLFDGATQVGTITSAARSARSGWVGLAYVKRGFDPPLEVEAGPGRVPAEVVALQ